MVENGCGGGCNVTVPGARWQMRTGLTYMHTWTLRGDAVQTLELNEYSEFRYWELAVEGAPGAGNDPQCLNTVLGDYTQEQTLACAGAGDTITTITFASYGTPAGCCSNNGVPGANTFVANASCNASTSTSALAAACVGRASCSFTLQALFPTDPCHDVYKNFDAAVQCAPALSTRALSAAPNPTPPPPPPLNVSVTAYVLTYPADYSTAATVTLADDAVMAVWNLTLYTVAAGGGLDMYVDSNARQRSVICAEALNMNILMQYATSSEWALPSYTLAYMLNGRPTELGWAEWQALAIISTHHVWMHTGDLTLFADHYQQLRTWTETTLINTTTGLWTCPGSGDPFSCTNPEIDWPRNMRDGFVFTPADTVVNEYTAYACDLFADLAAALGGHDGDVAKYRAAAVALRAAINSQLWDEGVGAYVDGLTTSHTAWHSSVYAVAFKVPTNASMAEAAARYIANRTLGDPATCQPGNVYPAEWALEGFYTNNSDHGNTAYAYLTCTGTNSWLNQLAQGATMTMEAWTPAEKPNLTWSHSWAASPAEAIVRWLFGVRPTAPGFTSIIVQPQPGPVLSGAAAVPSLRGPIAVAFTQTLRAAAAGPAQAATMRVAVTVPGATTALVCVPASTAASDGTVLVDGVAVAAQMMDDSACAAVSAGQHVVVGPGTAATVVA